MTLKRPLQQKYRKFGVFLTTFCQIHPNKGCRFDKIFCYSKVWNTNRNIIVENSINCHFYLIDNFHISHMARGWKIHLGSDAPRLVPS